MIKQTIKIPNSTSADIYEVLLDSKKHSVLIDGHAVVSKSVGDKFTTFDGYADGENVQLVPDKLIEQTWRASDWPKDHYSTILFELKDYAGGTEISFTQKNLPTGTEQEFESGWQDFYWEPLINYFKSVDV